MAEDDDLYSMLYGEEAPPEPQLPIRQIPHEEAHHPAEDNEGHLTLKDGQIETTTQASATFELVPDTGLPTADDTDDDLDVRLEEQPGRREEEDDLDIKLDESELAQPSGQAAEAAPSYRQPNSGNSFGAQQPTQANAQQKLALQGPANGMPPTRVPTTETGKRKYAEYDPGDPGVLPSQATKEGQRVRLPGQTRVTPEEYKEFLGLGHGDIFLLDIDCVVDAPWRAPGADPADYFNYGMNARTWQQYCDRVKQYQLEYTMQNSIQVYDRGPKAHRQDPDLPPELAAAVAEHRRDDRAALEPRGLANATSKVDSVLEQGQPLALPPPSSTFQKH